MILLSVHWKLLVTNNYPTVDKSVEVINFKSNNSLCSRPPDYPHFGKNFIIPDIKHWYQGYF